MWELIAAAAAGLNAGAGLYVAAVGHPGSLEAGVPTYWTLFPKVSNKSASLSLSLSVLATAGAAAAYFAGGSVPQGNAVWNGRVGVRSEPNTGWHCSCLLVAPAGPFDPALAAWLAYSWSGQPAVVAALPKTRLLPCPTCASARTRTRAHTFTHTNPNPHQATPTRTRRG